MTEYLVYALLLTTFLFFAKLQEQKGFKESNQRRHEDEVWDLKQQWFKEEEWEARVSLWRNECPEFHAYLANTDYDNESNDGVFETDAERNK